MNRMTVFLLCFWFLLVPAAEVSAQTTWYVDCNVAGPGTGTSGDPFSSIQAGLDACGSGDTVEVADGTCTENITWPGTDAITLRSASGDPSKCIVDGGGLDFVIAVGFGMGDPPGLEIEGLRVRNAGNRTIDGMQLSMGIGINPAAAVITAVLKNLEVQDNPMWGIAASSIYAVPPPGAGVNLTVLGSSIKGNGYMGMGAGVVYGSSGTVTIENCQVLENLGGIAVGSDNGTVTALIRNNVVSQNAGETILGPTGLGIGIEVFAAGLPDLSEYANVHADIIGNTVFNNSYGRGLSCGIYFMQMDQDATLTGSVVDNVVYGHTSTDNMGYGVFAVGLMGLGGSPGPGPELLIDRNWVFGNQGPSSAGIVFQGKGSITNNFVSSNGSYGIGAAALESDQILITNNTVVDNQSVGIFGPQGVEPYFGEVVVTNCIVGDWDSGTGATDLVGVIATSSHIQDLGAADPQFVDPAGDDGILGTMDDDYHIMPTSPCRNAGSSVSAPVDDFDGDARPLEGVFDIGADEYNENTATGTNVEVFFPDQQAVVIYDLVLQAGQTTMMKTPIFGVYLGLANLLSTYVYNVETSAEFEGQAKVCLQYEVGDPELEALLEEHGLIFVMTREGEDLVYLPRDKEDLDTVNNEVCGYADHFSEFTVGYEGCTDVDEDGYGDPGSGLCEHAEEDCNDSNAGVNPGMVEDCGTSGQGNGIDENCNGATDEGCGYSGVSNAEASVYGVESATGSGVLNQLLLLIVPAGAVVLWKRLRRRR